MRLLGLQASHYNHGSIQDKIHRGRREKKWGRNQGRRNGVEKGGGQWKKGGKVV
jgi:hypothetical protein